MSANLNKTYRINPSMTEKFRFFIKTGSTEELEDFHSFKKTWQDYELESYVYALNKFIIEGVSTKIDFLCKLQQSLFDSLDTDGRAKFLYGGYTAQLAVNPACIAPVISEDPVRIWKNHFDEIVKDKDNKFVYVYAPLLLQLIPVDHNGRDMELLDKLGRNFLEDTEKYGITIQELIESSSSTQDIATLVFGSKKVIGTTCDYENVVVSKDFHNLQMFLPYLQCCDISHIFSDANISNITKEQGRILFQHVIDAFEKHERFDDIYILFITDVPFPFDIDDQTKKKFFSLVLSKYSEDPRGFANSNIEAHQVFAQLCENNMDFLTQCFVMKSAFGISDYQSILNNLPQIHGKEHGHVELGNLIDEGYQSGA